jgi:hypothetical protein
LGSGNGQIPEESDLPGLKRMTIFRVAEIGVQQNVLDTSDDPDEHGTKRRISSHLRARNRRSDRFMRIPYLEDPHKDTHRN